MPELPKRDMRIRADRAVDPLILLPCDCSTCDHCFQGKTNNATRCWISLRRSTLVGLGARHRYAHLWDKEIADEYSRTFPEQKPT